MSSRKVNAPRIKSIVLLAFLASAMVLFVPATTHNVFAQTTKKLTQTDFELAVLPLSSRYPADGNSYSLIIQLQTKDGKPFESPYDLAIQLSSSDSSVITVPTSVVLRNGESMVTTEMGTTNKSGLVSITAQAEGTLSASATIDTKKLDSLEPTKLALYQAPSAFLPNPNVPGKIFVQLLNAQNLPAVTKVPVLVSFSLESTKIGTMPTTATIPAGSDGLFLDFTPTTEVGETTIRASATGLSPGEIKAKTAGPQFLKLVVEFAPPEIPSFKGYDGLMSIQVRDSDNIPVKLIKPLEAILRSSDIDVAEVPNKVTIPAGSSYIIDKVKSGGDLGTAVITASATGYVSGSGEVTTLTLAENNPESKTLNLLSVPTVLDPDNSQHQSFVVYFTDGSGNPYKGQYWEYSSIVLSSSNPQVGTIDSLLSTGLTYAVGKFTTTYLEGSTTITASASGLGSSSIGVEIRGHVPTALAVTQAPAIVGANNQSSESLFVSLVDSKGFPVAAAKNTAVFLSSSDLSIAEVPTSVFIPSGSAFTGAEMQLTQKAGETTIVASSQGLASGTSKYKTTGFSGSESEFSLALYAVPSLPADGRPYSAILVQLQDALGNPVPAESDVQVSLSSSSLIGGTVERQVIIRDGTSSEFATFTTSTVIDDVTITAASQGLRTVSTEIETTQQPLTMLASAPIPRTASFEELSVAYDVYSGTIPIQGVTVTTGGLHAKPTTALTDVIGHVDSVYVPSQPGQNSIIATASKPGFRDATVTSQISLATTVDVTIKTISEAEREFSAKLTITGANGRSTPTTAPNKPVEFTDARFGNWVITAPEEVKNNDGQYQFLRWDDGIQVNPRTFNIIGDTEITAVYAAKYMLNVVSAYGQITGSGFYDEGATATIGIEPLSIGEIISDRAFAGWTGATSSDSPRAEIVMNSPKTVTAEWSVSYLKLILIAAAGGGGGFFVYYKMILPKKRQEEAERAPDLDWYKS